jgi:16S rRNA processing protein RimM
MKIEDCFYIGYITKTKGLKGEVQLFFEYDKPSELPLHLLFVEIDNKLVPYFIASYKLQNNQTGLFFFDDLDTIEKAEKIIRKKVYLPHAQRPERSPNEFLVTDMKGFILHADLQGELGKIIDIREYPQQYIATFLYKNKEVMLPLNDHFIQKIDRKNQLLYVHLPEGLLELYLEE